MKAFLTGIDGQDGSYLSEFLLKNGYDVHGLIRRGVNPSINIKHLIGKIELHYGDLANENPLISLIDSLKPELLFNLAGQSDVAASFLIPEYTGDITGLGVTRILEAIRGYSPLTKLYQAGSSEMFGNSPSPQFELTPLKARSPYAAAKIYAHNMVTVYREAYGIFACNGILFNHESERRGINFVTRKISNAVARIYLKKQETLKLGNIQAKRDWGYAPDYVEAMWLMLQQGTPDDYVIGTGETHSVKDFVSEAFKHVGLDWEKYTRYNTAEFNRPGDVNCLMADATKAKNILGWKPKTKFSELVAKMVDYDIRREKCGQ